MVVTYSESLDCKINNNIISDTKWENKTFDSDSNLLSESSLNSDSDLKSFFTRNSNSTRNLNTNSTNWESLQTTTDPKDSYINDNTGYIEDRQETIACQFYENLNKDLYIIAIVVPVFYVVFIICLILFYCKYRRVSSQYQLLKGETEVNTGGNNTGGDSGKKNDVVDKDGGAIEIQFQNKKSIDN